MSSDIFPWMSEYNFRDLPDFDEICYLLDCVGEYATLNGHRLTFHPGPFNVLGSPNEKVVTKTIKELNQHSEIMDLMGFIPSYYNKINIHVGGTYGGDFDGTAERWCNNFLKLDDGTRARLTLENDDKASMWSTKQIHEFLKLDDGTRARLTLENDDKASMWSTKQIHEKIHSKIGIAQVHDIHHYTSSQVLYRRTNRRRSNETCSVNMGRYQTGCPLFAR
jgi:UV DNA damage repair endonuclease